MSLQLSVILCTHNPRADYLRRTLDALRQQTQPLTDWELILVDNASREPVSSLFSLGWHPHARLVIEANLGLTSARLRGIDEAHAPLLLFVDDDNLLATDYLSTALDLAHTWPQLGAWGCGDFTPEWEVAPAPSLGPLLDYLAVRRAPRDRWSNQLFDYAATPAGAGLCVRAQVARRYACTLRADPRRQRLDRTGNELTGCGDFDLALTSIDVGLGTGVFTTLALTHLMPRSRVEESYLLRLAEGHAKSTVFLMAFREPGLRPPASGLLSRLREWRLRRALSPLSLKIHDARRRGENAAWAALFPARD